MQDAIRLDLRQIINEEFVAKKTNQMIILLKKRKSEELNEKNKQMLKTLKVDMVKFCL